MDPNKIVEGIKKTGFKLEFDTSQSLIKNDWTVINNKYYVDDLQDSVREIDLVAYKATKILHFFIYTVLIVSCKKNEQDAWALLSKERNPIDPNAEWLPVHAWSNDKALAFMIKNKKWKDEYLSNNKVNGSTLLSKVPNKHIFAFQEMNKSSGKPNNDKNIFNSITSLMKAQAYEMNALPVRKKDPSVFQFNLVSVVDAELARVDFSDSKIQAQEIDDEVYVADYIIDKKQTSAKIHFIQSSFFERCLKDYNLLHEANVLSFKDGYQLFYSDVAQNDDKRKVFLDEIKRDMFWRITASLKHIGNEFFEEKDSFLWWNKEQKILEFAIPLSPTAIDKLNDDKHLINHLKKVLKKHLQYEGKCIFVVDIPF